MDVVGYTAVSEKHSEGLAGNPIGGTLLAPDQNTGTSARLPHVQERTKEL